MPINFNPKASYSQRPQANKQELNFGIKFKVPRDSGDTQDIIDEVFYPSFRPNEEVIESLDNAFIKCKAYLREELSEAYEKLGIIPPSIPKQ